MTSLLSDTIISYVCASLDQVQVADLSGFSSAALIRQIKLCNLT